LKQNKNIDKLFRENLRNLDSKPSEKVWAGIEAELKKKKKRVVSFWWFSSGIAAVLILGIFLFPFSSDEELDKNNKRNIEIITNSPKNKVDQTLENNIDFISPSEENRGKEEVIVSNQKPNANAKKSFKKKSSFIADNTNLSSEKEVKNITEKESTLDSKKAMKKIFKSESTENSESKKQKKIDNKEQEFLKPKKDFLAITEEKDSIKLNNISSKKWSVSPSFAVLQSNSFSNNSSLDASLNQNTTTGDNTYSYGIKVAYEINKKWTIQSGIHLQEIGFSTKDVTIAASFSKQGLANVNSDAQLSFNGKSSMEASDIRSSNFVASSEQGELNQRFGYVEIPLEIKYNLSNSDKFKTEIVTGFSSLFLNKNSINLSSNSISGNLGEANNLNTFNFSGNVGFDFNYAVDKNLFLNLNPMFKAQLNTFSKNSNGFQPYYFGIYTGIKYQF